MKRSAFQNSPRAAGDSSSAFQDRWIPALLMALLLITCWPLLKAEFTIWDDYAAVVTCPWLNPPSWPHFAEFWNYKNPYMDIWIPLTYTVWSALAVISYVPTVDPDTGAHLNPWIFHGANVAIHAISVLLVFAILKRAVHHPWAAAAGAALFAIHPVQVEPVGWIAGMKDLLAGCMGLVAIWQYLQYADATRNLIPDQGTEQSHAKRDLTPSPLYAGERAGVRGQKREMTNGRDVINHVQAPHPARSPDEREEGKNPTNVQTRQGNDNASTASTKTHYLIALAAFILAMLAKPSGIVIPLILGVLDLWLIRRPLRKIATALAPWLLLTIPIIIIGRHAQPAPGIDVPLVLRPLIATDALAFYLYKLFCPIWLAITYYRGPHVVLAHHWEWYTWVVPAAALTICWLVRRKCPWFLAALGVYWAAVLPVLGLVPFEFQLYSTVGDHYLYLAMFGPALAVAFALRNQKSKAAAAATILLLAALATRSWVATLAWQDSVSLFANAVRVNPHSAEAYNDLAEAYRSKRDYNLSAKTFREGLSHNPDFAPLRVGYASLLVAIDQPDEARRQFQIASATATGEYARAIQQSLTKLNLRAATSTTNPSSKPDLTPTSSPIK